MNIKEICKMLLSQHYNFDDDYKKILDSWYGGSYTALQVFELIDTCRTYEDLNPMILGSLQRLLDKQLIKENKTMASLISEVTWWKKSNIEELS